MNTISPRMLFLREFRTHILIQPHTNNLDPTCYRLERTQQALHVHSIEEKVTNFIQKHWLLGFMNSGLSKFPLHSHAHTLLQGITTCTPTQQHVAPVRGCVSVRRICVAQKRTNPPTHTQAVAVLLHIDHRVQRIENAVVCRRQGTKIDSKSINELDVFSTGMRDR